MCRAIAALDNKAATRCDRPKDPLAMEGLGQPRKTRFWVSLACSRSGHPPSCTLLGKGGIELVDPSPLPSRLAPPLAEAVSPPKPFKDANAGLKLALSTRFPRLAVHV